MVMSKEELPLANSDDEKSGLPGDTGGSATFSINHDFARRFEHNQRRAELHRCLLMLIRFVPTEANAQQ